MPDFATGTDADGQTIAASHVFGSQGTGINGWKSQMFGFVRFVIGTLVGLVGGFFIAIGAMHYHFLRTENSMAFVPKRYPTLEETYLDIRDWSITEWSEHPDLVHTLFKNDRQDLLPTIDGQIASFKRLIEK